MFRTISVDKISFALIGTLFALCLFSTVGCSGGAISSVHAEDLRQSVKTVESERDKALRRAKTAEDAIASVKTERDRALRRAKTAEDAIASVKTKRDRALRRAKTAEDAIASVKTERDRALRRAKTAEDAIASVKTERDRALRRAKTAEDAIARAETARDKALKRAKTAEDAIARAETARYRALKRAKTAEDAIASVESARDRALRRAENAEEELENLRELVDRAPQATIKNVSVNPKKKSMDISVTFSIKNRKDIEGSVYVYFYFQDGEKLPDKKGNPISIREKFTPKSVTETLTVKLPMSYDKLNLRQPDKLMFSVRIYDKPTNSFLNKERYLVSFSYDSRKNNPVWLTDR